MIGGLIAMLFVDTWLMIEGKGARLNFCIQHSRNVRRDPFFSFIMPNPSVCSTYSSGLDLVELGAHEWVNGEFEIN